MRGQVTIYTPTGEMILKNQVLYSGHPVFYAVLSGLDTRNKIYLLRLGTSNQPTNPNQTDLISPLPYDFLVSNREFDATGVRYNFLLSNLPTGLKFSEAAIYGSYYDIITSNLITATVARITFATVTIASGFIYQLDWKFNLV